MMIRLMCFIICFQSPGIIFECVPNGKIISFPERSWKCWMTPVAESPRFFRFPLWCHTDSQILTWVILRVTSKHLHAAPLHAWEKLCCSGGCRHFPAPGSCAALVLSEEPSDAHQSALGSAAAVGGLGVSVGVSIQLLCNWALWLNAHGNTPAELMPSTLQTVL